MFQQLSAGWTKGCAILHGYLSHARAHVQNAGTGSGARASGLWRRRVRLATQKSFAIPYIR